MGDADFYTTIKEDWSSGELAPSWLGRVSSPEYKSGCALLYNMLPRSGGGIRRRPGSRFIAVPTVDTGTNVRLIPFTGVYGDQLALLLNIASGVATISVYSMTTHAWVADIVAGAPPYAAPSFTSLDIPNITYAQTNGMTFLFLGTGAGTPGGLPVCVVYNTQPDLSGVWKCYVPSFYVHGPVPAFNTSNNYPACGEFYAGRLFMASTNLDRLAVWACSLPAIGSDPGLADTYINFDIGAGLPADAIFLRQNDINAPCIRWLFSSQTILAATDRSVWMQYDATAPDPSTFSFRRSASYGALAASRPVQVVNVALYIGADAKSFRSLILSIQRGFYADGDLSDHAEHLMSRKAVDFCVTLKPDPTAWIVMQDGTLVSATVKQEDSGFVVKAGCGFAQHQLGGEGIVKSICKLNNTYWDELWMAVERGGTLSLEYLYLDDINSTPQTQSFYVDCGQVQDTAGQKTFTGIPSPLEGQTVVAMGDGSVMPEATVTSGSVTYKTSVAYLNIGFPYYSSWQDVRPMLPAKGSSLGHLRKAEKSWLLIHNSGGGWIGQEAPADPLGNPETTLTDFWPKMQTYNIQLYGYSPLWVSGIIDVDHPGIASMDGQIYVCINDPVPFNLVAIATRYALSEA
jgi:hypothetical protein